MTNFLISNLCLLGIPIIGFMVTIQLETSFTINLVTGFTAIVGVIWSSKRMDKHLEVQNESRS